MQTLANPEPAVKLRLYQRDTLTELQQRAAAGETRLLVSWPTGSGKTVLAAEICRRARTRVLFIAHRAELLEQAA